MNSLAPEKMKPEISTAISGFGTSFSSAMIAVTSTITARFIARNTSRINIGPAQQITHETPCPRPWHNEVRLLECTRVRTQACGSRPFSKARIFHGVPCKTPATISAALVKNGTSRLRPADHIIDKAKATFAAYTKAPMLSQTKNILVNHHCRQPRPARNGLPQLTMAWVEVISNLPVR